MCSMQVLIRSTIWVYRAGLENLQYSLATAVGLFKSVISVILIVIGYKLADKFTGYKLF